MKGGLSKGVPTIYRGTSDSGSINRVVPIWLKVSLIWRFHCTYTNLMYIQCHTYTYTVICLYMSNKLFRLMCMTNTLCRLNGLCGVSGLGGLCV
jgi:hypothetical protein